MAIFSLSDIAIRGVSAAAPAQAEDNETLDLLVAKDRKLFIEQTGIRYRRIAPPGITAADLCVSAVKPLLKEMDWLPADIDVLIFITQTPDYQIPNTSSVIHHRLGLSKQCIVMDINLGCSGYVYGLSVIGSLLQHIPGGRGLLLVGDCSTSIISRNDKSTWPLFGDAGSATAIQQWAGSKMDFNLQADGSGYEDIMIRGGSGRHPFTTDSLTEQQYENGIMRSDLHMKLDGINVFNFALREVAPNIQALLQAIDMPEPSIDHFVLHQANKLMIDCVRKKMKIAENKFPLSLYHYGNTSSASIPMTIVTELQKLSGQNSHLLLCGFGVGLSWGSVCLDWNKAIILPLVEG
jgi:3-oxoacyl-[acyl-carrier-protein] synthase-3